MVVAILIDLHFLPLLKLPVPRVTIYRQRADFNCIIGIERYAAGFVHFSVNCKG